MILTVLGPLSVAVGFNVAGSPPGDPAKDSVIKAVAPEYIAIPNGNGTVLQGLVMVEVVIDIEGAVIETRVLSEHDTPIERLLPLWARKAAAQWRFEPAAAPLTRRHNLSFSFDGRRRTDEPGGYTSWYENPLTLHIEFVEPTVELLERIDGRIPPKSCTVHKVPMSVERVPIHYGLWSLIEGETRYLEARDAEFPNAHRVKRRGDLVSSETYAEVYVCQLCLQAEERWHTEHPELAPSYQ